MPRGTRALHDVAGTPGATESFSATIRAETLVSLCWCGHRYVKVATLDVCRGNTATCGAIDCRPLFGREPCPGEVVRMRGSTWINATGSVTKDVQYSESDDAITMKRRKRRQGRTADARVTKRRLRVAELWHRGTHVLDIALIVDTEAHNINADIRWLRARGMIRPRPKRKSA